ncbi:hypothetical protein F5Y10DRAFT_270273 [Nemania abortiva]|nr:hypothetical protein F5Y10DRAFT_270273 [Nemania abortiva]
MKSNNTEPNETASNKPPSDESIPKESASRESTTKESTSMEPHPDEISSDSGSSNYCPDASSSDDYLDEGSSGYYLDEGFSDDYLDASSSDDRPPIEFTRPRDSQQHPHRGGYKDAIDFVYEHPSSTRPDIAPWVEVGEDYTHQWPQETPRQVIIRALDSMISGNQPPTSDTPRTSNLRRSPAPVSNAKEGLEHNATGDSKEVKPEPERDEQNWKCVVIRFLLCAVMIRSLSTARA